MIDRLNTEMIDEVTSIHVTSWAPYEISVKLGKHYLNECFYKIICQSKNAFGFVYYHHNKIIAYAIGFYDYPAFQKEIRRKVLLPTAFHLIRGIISQNINISDINMILNDHHKMRNLYYPKHHLGALALAKEYKSTELGKNAIVGVIDAVLSELKDKGCPGCWGICDERNIPMQKYLLKMGFLLKNEWKISGRNILLYELKF